MTVITCGNFLVVSELRRDFTYNYNYGDSLPNPQSSPRPLHLILNHLAQCGVDRGLIAALAALFGSFDDAQDRLEPCNDVGVEPNPDCCVPILFQAARNNGILSNASPSSRSAISRS